MRKEIIVTLDSDTINDDPEKKAVLEHDIEYMAMGEGHYYNQQSRPLSIIADEEEANSANFDYGEKIVLRQQFADL